MISQLLSRLMILVFGTLYPAYRSYKAVKTKDVREYVKWMMYWIVFAFFTALENAADILISWLPLYYEVKIAFLIWLLSPATKGSSILYRKFVHPWLTKHEEEIDKYIDTAKQSSYATLLRVGRHGISVATDTFLKTAVTGQSTLLNTLRKYSSMQDLSRSEPLDTIDGGENAQSRTTWHGNPSRNEQDDQLQYDFDDDYRILEEQYQHRNPEMLDTLPGAAPMVRTSSTQNIIPESREESEQDTAEEEPILVDDPPPPSSNAPTSTRHRSESNSGNSSSNNRRSAGRSTANDVSQIRGYSTLPRSRNAKTAAVSQPQYGGTLPRTSRRTRAKLQPKSHEM